MKIIRGRKYKGRLLDRLSLGFCPALSLNTINISRKLNGEDLTELRRIHMEWRGFN
jgi:hypothetical protein